MPATINRQTISTSAHQSDIFVLSQAGLRFINQGNLSTSGNQSSPIDIAANNVVVQNFGNLSVSGADAPVILAGHRDAPLDGVSVYNHGAISNTGSFVDLNGNGAIDVEEYFPDGIAFYGTNGYVENRGTITTGSGAGIGTLASDTTILNAGEIRANSFGMVIDNFGGGHDRNTIINDGLIHVTGGTFGAAIDVRSNDNQVINEVEIIAQGTEYVGILLRGVGNYGENSGIISVSGADSTAVYLYGEGHSFLNLGIAASEGIAVRIEAEQPLGLTTGTFTNLGRVQGGILGSSGNETIINRGSIFGNVSLGDGSDRYLAGNKSRNGAVDLGAGDDQLILEKGFGSFSVTGFLAGADSNDVIDVSALGIASFDALLRYASTAGSDTLFQFGKSQLILSGTTLESLTAGDFIFSGSGAAALSFAMPAGAETDWLII